MVPMMEKRGGLSSWLIDSGAEQDLVSEPQPREVKSSNIRQTCHPVSLTAANGSIQASEVVDVKLKPLPEPVCPYALGGTPAVLSVGLRDMDMGYSFAWP